MQTIDTNCKAEGFFANQRSVSLVRSSGGHRLLYTRTDFQPFVNLKKKYIILFFLYLIVKLHTYTKCLIMHAVIPVEGTILECVLVYCMYVCVFFL